MVSGLCSVSVAIGLDCGPLWKQDCLVDICNALVGLHWTDGPGIGFSRITPHLGIDGSGTSRHFSLLHQGYRSDFSTNLAGICIGFAGLLHEPGRVSCPQDDLSANWIAELAGNICSLCNSWPGVGSLIRIDHSTTRSSANAFATIQERRR